MAEKEPERPGPSGEKYDDDYFDSSDDEKIRLHLKRNSSILFLNSNSFGKLVIREFFTHKFSDRRVKSNDELLYDPGADDADEKWMEERGKSIQKARNSDAVLNCPRLALFSFSFRTWALETFVN